VPACSLAYITFSREAFVRNMSFSQGNTLNLPFSIKLFCFKMSNQFNVLCFHGLSIPMKSASLFLGLY
jgi:hypothetical protein